MKSKDASVTIPIKGLSDMEAAESILLEMEEAAMLEYSPDGRTTVVPVGGDETLQSIDRMKREINKGGCGFEMEVRVALVPETDPVPGNGSPGDP